MENFKLSVKNLIAIAVVLQIVWGIVPSTSKVVISEIPVELFIAIRWTISGLVFSAIVFIFAKWPPLFKKETGLAALLGILGYGFGSMGTLYGLKIGGVTNFALIGAVSPIITSIVAIVLLREKPIRMFYIALSLCVMGMFFLFLENIKYLLDYCSFNLWVDFNICLFRSSSLHLFT